MKVQSAVDNSFTGDGIPPIPEDARRLAVSDRVVAYISDRDEVWECYIGNGTTQSSQTYYWPSLGLCPRDWAQEAIKLS